MHSPTTLPLAPDDLMADLLARFPGARRALFAAYHVGGCQSCAYRDDETLAEVCARNEIDVNEAMAALRASHERDRAMLISPVALKERLASGPPLRLLDTRTREEHEAVRIAGSEFLTQDLQQELMAGDPDQALVLYDHRGRDILDRCAWFHGHGLRNVLALEGGIDAWAREAEPGMQRYRLELE